MSLNPKVSIITACYNSEQTIAACIKSCLQQTYSDIEHIFVDGGSSDETCSIITSLIPRANLVSERDSGIYNAFNKGLERSSGDFVFFLNSDDFFSGKLVVEKAINVALEQDVECLFTGVEITSKYLNFVRSYRPKHLTASNLERGLMPPHTGSFIRKSIYEKLGGFDESYTICGDYDLFCRLAVYGNFSSSIAESIIAVRMASGGASSSNLGARLKLHFEIFRSLKQNGLNASHLKLLTRYLRKLFEFRLDR